VGGIASFYKGWLDLSPYISADNYDMTRFVGVTGEMHNYPGQGMLGLPLCVYPQAMYYNEDIFDAAGVDYPPAKYGEKYADGSTWDFTKVREIAKKMSLDASGNDANSNAFDPKSITQVGWLNWDWYTPIDFTRQFGDLPGGGVSEDGTKSVLAEKQYIDALTYYKTAIWDDHVSNDSEQAGAIQGSAGDPFGGGKAAMWENHTWMSYAYAGWDQAFKWNVGAVPQGTNGKVTVIVDADTAVIPAQAKNPDQSWEVMKWLFEPEQYKVLIDNYGCLPADKELVKTWVSDMTAKYPGVNFQIFVDGLDYLEPSPNHEAWKPEYNKVNDIMTNAVGQIQAGTNTDVQAVMQDASSQVQKLLDDYWAANP